MIERIERIGRLEREAILDALRRVLEPRADVAAMVRVARAPRAR